jgi:hypothetical protein
MGYFRKLLTTLTILSVTTVSSFAMKAEYRFEDCGGATTSKEHTSSGLDGFLNSNAKVTVGDGKIENALSLLGSGGVMSVEPNSNLDLTRNFSIAFWINPSKIGKQAIISKGFGEGSLRYYAENGEFFIFMQDDGKLAYMHNNSLANTVIATTSNPIPKDEWTHIIFTRDFNTKQMRFYIDGVSDKKYRYNNHPQSSNSEKLIIGGADSSNYSSFIGKLDEIKIFEVSLSQDDITKIYDDESSGTHTTGECSLAPYAQNDNYDLPYGGTVTIDILSNDKNNDSSSCSVDSSTVKIVSHIPNAIMSDDNRTLTIPSEGVWSVNINGSITFVSEDSFKGNPTPIEYVVSDSCGSLSNIATITLTRVATGTPNNGRVDEDCQCDDYESSIPSINLLGVIVILILTGLLGVLFIQREELYKNQTKDNR